MTITTDQIKALREKTGLSVMQIKKALEEADGSEEKAMVILTKKSGEIAAKKADRELGAGVVQGYIHHTHSVGAMVELNCETDFVAKNEDFVALARDIAMHAAAMRPKFLNREEITEDDLKAAKEVFAEEVKDKPADMQEKILAGKLDSYLADRVLLEQTFIKDGEKTIAQLIEEATQKFGERCQLSRYVVLGVLEE